MEEHREKAWTREQLTAFLEDAGFSGVRFSGDLTRRPPAEDEDRWIVVCDKPADGPEK